MTLPVHLHVHSHYSFLEALPSPEELAQKAADLGMPAIALTDHLSLTGSVEFYRACLRAGVKPILGLEIDLALPESLAAAGGGLREGDLVLLAQDLSGWQNLCRINSALLAGDEKIPASLDLLNHHAAGLICLSGGQRSLAARLAGQGQLAGAAQLLGSLGEIFSQCFFLELQNGGQSSATNNALVNLARQLSLPLVAAQEIYYLQEGEADLQKTLAAIRLSCTRSNLPAGSTAPPAAHFVSPPSLAAAFSDFPQAVSAGREIAEQCSLQLPLGVPHFPKIPLPPGVTAREYLRQKAEEGAQRLYGSLTPVVRRRLEHELRVIGQRGYETIFLIVEEIMSYARQKGIPTSSRGSAASSLVAHCLGITSPDPLQLDLYFERFLNPARASPPDIDTDLCSRRRDEVIQHIFEKYGQQQVAMVGTINCFRPRSALGDVAKAHGLSPAEVKALTRNLPSHFRFMQEAHDEGQGSPAQFADLVGQFPQPKYRLIFNQAAALLGKPRHLSVHAGGLVVAPGAITDYAPVQRSGSKGITITQLDLESVEQLGLVKIDLLGIRGLTVMGDVANSIYSWQRKDYQNPLDVLENIPLDDPETASLVENARTIGCFQIESPGMRATLKDVRARSIEDIIAALALYRPGPLKGGLRDAYVKRHNRLEAVEHIHPALAPMLGDTYGVILYQEQVLRIAHNLAGFDLADADLLRRAMSHFDPGRQMEALRQKFIEAAGQKSGVPAETAARIWELMAAFAGYGFPKAHAASYALAAWRSAWCKAHHPAEFMAAILANWGGYYNQSVYLAEARRQGLRVRPPHINHSQPEFNVVYPSGKPELFMGLDQVRGLTRRTQQRILRCRPFSSLTDLLVRADPHPQEAESLIRVGALEGLAAIPALLRQLENERRHPGQFSLFDLEPEAEVDDWSLSEKVAAQQELLGSSVDAHPLELRAPQISAAQALTTLEALSRVGERVRVAGVRQSMHRSRTTRHETMAFMTLEDLEGALEVVLFPAVYRLARPHLAGHNPILIEGIIEADDNRPDPLLKAEKVIPLD